MDSSSPADVSCVAMQPVDYIQSPHYARDLEAKVNMLEERLAKLEADSAQALAKPAVDGVVLPGKSLMSQERQLVC
jgi:hypothetical protein